MKYIERTSVWWGGWEVVYVKGVDVCMDKGDVYVSNIHLYFERIYKVYFINISSKRFSDKIGVMTKWAKWENRVSKLETENKNHTSFKL